jgi:glycosyltransferase involved in cell wall biosynthesis
MNSELLSICIPTRNRAKYLREILTTFAHQVQEGGISGEELAFYVSDNASEDETPEVFREFARKVPEASYSRNPVNIGGDGNNIHVRTLAKGEYLWVLGDDELVCDKAVAAALRLIREHRPGLILAYHSRYELKIPVPQVFPDYRAFARECIQRNVHALAEHTLVSSNIFRADCYDGAYAKENLKTYFPHMFGMIRPLMRNKASVVLPDCAIISVRESPPSPVDGVWMPDLDAAWIHYFKWLREELQLPELDPYAPSEHARRTLIDRMVHNPFRFIANNWRSLFRPTAYRFVFNRLFRKRR